MRSNGYGMQFDQLKKARTPHAKQSIDLVAAFRQRLSESGYVEGRYVQIDYRSANMDSCRFREWAAACVPRRIAVIFAAPPAAATAAKAATDTMPVGSSPCAADNRCPP